MAALLFSTAYYSGPILFFFKQFKEFRILIGLCEQFFHHAVFSSSSLFSVKGVFLLSRLVILRLETFELM